MPEWIHERAKHISAKNPDMSESTAWAIATQQSHSLGKTPKSYGTKAGRTEAKAKYDTPKGDEHKANPGGLESEKVAGIAIQYDMDGKAKSAETSDQWLAAHFKATGAFLIPASLVDSEVDFQQSKYAQVRRDAFLGELGRIAVQEMMQKEALDPRLTRSLVGAGIGAGLGGATGYIGTKATEDLPMPGEEQPDHAARNAAIGAAIGGLTGGGLGYLSGKSSLHGTMADVHELHGAQEALDVMRKQKPPPAPTPATPDPDKLQELSQYLEYLKTPEVAQGARLREPTVRMRLGASPGHVARVNMARRRALATGLDLPEEVVTEAGKGKFGAAKLTQEEAEAALKKYQKLKEQKPTAGEIARYAAIGGLVTPVAGVIRHQITGMKPGTTWHGGPLPGATGAMRTLAGHAAYGAIGSGLIPVIRHHLDTQAEASKLKSFLASDQAREALQLPDGDGGELKTGSVGPEGGFSQSEYSTPIEGPKRARQSSYIPPGHKTAEDMRSEETINRAKQRAYGRVAGGALGLGTGTVAGLAGARALSNAGHPIIGGVLGMAAPVLGTYGGWHAGGELAKAVQGAPPSQRKEAGVGPEAGFSGTGYGDTGGFVDFHQVSALNGPPTQSLQEKPFSSPSGGRVSSGSIMIPTVKTSAPTLATTARIGKKPAQFGDIGSVNLTAKPKGFGQPAVGSTQTK